MLLSPLLSSLILLGLCFRAIQGGPSSNNGSPFFRPHYGWGVTPSSALPRVPSSTTKDNIRPPPLNPRAQRYLDEQLERMAQEQVKQPAVPRGGQDADAFVKLVGTITRLLVGCGKLVLPPAAAMTQLIVAFYRALPKDAIMAQIGLVCCFAGGYYPTLFSSLQAAQQCGWNVMVAAIADLTDEALRVIHALEDAQSSTFGGFADANNESANFDEADRRRRRERRTRSFRKNTSIVLATVDPMKINQAAGALYTTWLGVSSVLEKEYARVITLSLTMASYIERVATFILAPPAYLCVKKDYHQWVPVVIGWGCKAASMNIAWRIQRVMTAASKYSTIRTIVEGMGWEFCPIVVRNGRVWKVYGTSVRWCC